jgi:hypothetical protein
MRYAAQATSTGNTKYSISTSSELMNQKRKSAQPEERQQCKQHIPVKILNHAKPPYRNDSNAVSVARSPAPRSDETLFGCDKTKHVPNGKSEDSGGGEGDWCVILQSSRMRDLAKFNGETLAGIEKGNPARQEGAIRLDAHAKAILSGNDFRFFKAWSEGVPR